MIASIRPTKSYCIAGILAGADLAFLYKNLISHTTPPKLPTISVNMVPESGLYDTEFFGNWAVTDAIFVYCNIN